MDISAVLDELRRERQYIEDAILNLERLARGHGHRRGRSPKRMSEVQVKRQGRPPGSSNKPKEPGEA